MAEQQANADTLVLRDHLAIERTYLANERTLLAYLRTAIMLLISSVTLLKLFASSPLLVVSGYALVPAAVVTALLGFGRFARTRRSLVARSGNHEPLDDGLE